MFSHRGLLLLMLLILINNIPYILAAHVLCFCFIARRWEIRENYSKSKSDTIFNKVYSNISWKLLLPPEGDPTDFNIKVTDVGSTAFTKRKMLRSSKKKARRKQVTIKVDIKDDEMDFNGLEVWGQTLLWGGKKSWALLCNETSAYIPWISKWLRILWLEASFPQGYN